jgi:hypothetical protein
MTSRKMISITEKTYKDLAKMGTLEDSFDSVIQKMIRERKWIATSGPASNHNQNAATAPLSRGDNG